MAWEYKGGSGRWQEWINDETGESSIKEHKIKSIQTFCKHEDHYYEPISKNSREIKCRKCGVISRYVLGLQKLIDGKIVQG